MELKLRSTITPELKQKTLFRGCGIAIIGLLTLGIGYFKVSVETLETWGWAFYLWGLFFIIWGMLPYRKLIRIEDFPFEVWSSESGETEMLSFGKNHHLFWRVFSKDITGISYENDSSYYGIVIMTGIKRHFCPYFSKRSFNELEEFLQKPNQL